MGSPVDSHEPSRKEWSVHSKKPLHPSGTSLLFRLRLPNVLRELAPACQEASTSWSDEERQRAQEIAVALADAFRVEGLREPAVVAKSLGCLMQLSREQIQPIEKPLREKVQELLNSLKGSADQVLTGT